MQGGVREHLLTPEVGWHQAVFETKEQGSTGEHLESAVNAKEGQPEY